MRVLRNATIALFVCSAALAQTQEPAPCTALTPKVQPCAQPAEPRKSAPAAPKGGLLVATLDGSPIFLSDLDEATQKTALGLAGAQGEARQKAIRAQMDDVLLELEAHRLEVTPAQLLKTNVFDRVPRPSDADIDAEIAAHPDKYKGAGEHRERAAANVLDARRKAREKEYVAGLEKRYGPRNLSTARAGLRVDTAVADVAIDVAETEKNAVDRTIHDRLLRAEAQRQGISPDELTRREVTAKLAPPTDGELKAAWEKYKPFFDDDLAAARNDVVEWVNRENKTSAEKAFDERLRKGHDIRVLVDVPQRPAQTFLAAAHAPSSGPDDAAVTLVEFGDFQCPPCRYMSGIVDEALRPYASRVRYVFHQYPMSFHAFALKAAEAALAADAQGKFFPYAHVLFANQKQLDVASLKKYATEAGLDRKRFDEDLDSGRFAAAVIDDQRLGERAGVLGTPMFFVNGVRLGFDAYSLEGLRAAIDQAIASAR